MVIAERKTVCKVALVNLDEPTAAILRDSFKQFRIQAVDVVTRKDHRLGDEKFDACVLRLERGCEPVLEALRSSPRDRHMIIYGVSTPGQTLQQVSKYGINVMLTYPLDRQSALKVVRTTHLLVLHEFRRYARVPMITEVQLEYLGTKYRGTTVELSGGGMSMQLESPLELGKVVEALLKLPDRPAYRCAATVCWLRADRQMIGVRFDPGDPRRAAIRQWIEEYLQI